MTTEELIADLAKQVGALETEKRLGGQDMTGMAAEVFAVARDLRTWIEASYSASARTVLTPIVERLEGLVGVPPSPAAPARPDGIEAPAPVPYPDAL